MISPVSFIYQVAVILFSPRLHQLATRVSGLPGTRKINKEMKSTDSFGTYYSHQKSLFRPRSPFFYNTKSQLLKFSNVSLDSSYLALFAAIPYARVIVSVTGGLYALSMYGVIDRTRVLLMFDFVSLWALLNLSRGLDNLFLGTCIEPLLERLVLFKSDIGPITDTPFPTIKKEDEEAEEEEEEVDDEDNDVDDNVQLSDSEKNPQSSPLLVPKKSSQNQNKNTTHCYTWKKSSSTKRCKKSHSPRFPKYTTTTATTTATTMIPSPAKKNTTKKQKNESCYYSLTLLPSLVTKFRKILPRFTNMIVCVATLLSAACWLACVGLTLSWVRIHTLSAGSITFPRILQKLWIANGGIVILGHCLKYLVFLHDKKHKWFANVQVGNCQNIEGNNNNTIKQEKEDSIIADTTATVSTEKKEESTCINDEEIPKVIETKKSLLNSPCTSECCSASVTIDGDEEEEEGDDDYEEEGEENKESLQLLLNQKENQVEVQNTNININNINNNNTDETKSKIKSKNNNKNKKINNDNINIISIVKMIEKK